MVCRQGVRDVYVLNSIDGTDTKKPGNDQQIREFFQQLLAFRFDIRGMPSSGTVIRL
jgi:hypothetical protein